MIINSNKVATGSTWVLGLLGTLLVSFFEDDKVTVLYNTCINTVPKLPLFISLLLIIVTYYSTYQYFILRREIRNNMEKYEKERKSNEEKFEKDKKKTVDEYEQQIKELREEYDNKIKELNTYYSNQLHEQKNRIADLGNQMDTVNKKKDDLFKRNNELEGENKQITKELSEVKDKYKREENERKEEIKKKNNEISELNYKIKNISHIDLGTIWAHNVLIIDDEPDIVTNIRRKLQGMNIHVDTALEIPDYRFAADYEIIISDIFQCAPAEESTSVLNTIKEKYPYKFVYAMSIQPAACQGLDIDGRIIQKDEGYQYVSSIVDLVRDSCKKLNQIDEHWNDVEKKLQIKGLSENLIFNIKSFYYNFVKRMQIYH